VIENRDVDTPGGFS